MLPQLLHKVGHCFRISGISLYEERFARELRTDGAQDSDIGASVLVQHVMYWGLIITPTAAGPHPHVERSRVEIDQWFVFVNHVSELQTE